MRWIDVKNLEQNYLCGLSILLPVGHLSGIIKQSPRIGEVALDVGRDCSLKCLAFGVLGVGLQHLLRQVDALLEAFLLVGRACLCRKLDKVRRRRVSSLKVAVFIWCCPCAWTVIQWIVARRIPLDFVGLRPVLVTNRARPIHKLGGRIQLGGRKISVRPARFR